MDLFKSVALNLFIQMNLMDANEIFDENEFIHICMHSSKYE